MASDFRTDSTSCIYDNTNVLFYMFHYGIMFKLGCVVIHSYCKAPISRNDLIYMSYY
jgi:hypothetical protein